MKNQKLTSSNKQISIPLFVPLIIFFAILVINIYNSNSKVSASSSESTLNNNLEGNIEGTFETIEEEESNLKNNEVENIEKENTQETENINDKQKEENIYTASNGEQYTVIGIVNIPSLGIEYPILSSTSTELLKISVTKYWGADPNEVGNLVVLGHNYNDNKFFSKLPNIKVGEIIKITDLTGKTLEYKVYDTEVIDPYDNGCTSQLTDGKTEVTLITCYNYGRDRFVAKARAN